MTNKNLKVYENTFWILKTDEEYRIGLTNAIQDDMGAITFVSLPKVGERFVQGDALVEVESEKSVSELTSPLTGVIAKINDAAEKDPNVLNNPDQMEAWIATFTGVIEDEFFLL